MAHRKGAIRAVTSVREPLVQLRFSQLDEEAGQALDQDFHQPSGIVMKTIDHISGEPAPPDAKEAVSAAFKTGTEPGGP